MRIGPYPFAGPDAITAPCVVGARDFGNVIIGQLAVHAVNQRAHLPRVNEKRLAAPVRGPPLWHPCWR